MSSVRKKGEIFDLWRFVPCSRELLMAGRLTIETRREYQRLAPFVFIPAAKSAKWGLSEAELFISRGAGEGEMQAIVGPAADEGSENIVRRNLIIGVGLAVVAGVLAVVRPLTLPSFDCSVASGPSGRSPSRGASRDLR